MKVKVSQIILHLAKSPEYIPGNFANIGLLSPHCIMYDNTLRTSLVTATRERFPRNLFNFSSPSLLFPSARISGRHPSFSRSLCSLVSEGNRVRGDGRAGNSIYTFVRRNRGKQVRRYKTISIYRESEKLARGIVPKIAFVMLMGVVYNYAIARTVKSRYRRDTPVY